MFDCQRLSKNRPQANAAHSFLLTLRLFVSAAAQSVSLVVAVEDTFTQPEAAVASVAQSSSIKKERDAVSQCNRSRSPLDGDG
jgi:hypothetical protein